MHFYYELNVQGEISEILNQRSKKNKLKKYLLLTCFTIFEPFLNFVEFSIDEIISIKHQRDLILDFPWTHQ